MPIFMERYFKTHLFCAFCFVDSVEDDILKQPAINHRLILITIYIFNYFCYIHTLIGQFHISSGNANIANIADIKMSSSTESAKQYYENQCL